VKTLKKTKKNNALREAKRILRLYSRRKGTSPLKLIKISEFIAKSKLHNNESESKLYKTFYRYLLETGNLELVNGRLKIKG